MVERVKEGADYSGSHVKTQILTFLMDFNNALRGSNAARVRRRILRGWESPQKNFPMLPDLMRLKTYNYMPVPDAYLRCLNEDAHDYKFSHSQQSHVLVHVVNCIL